MKRYELIFKYLQDQTEDDLIFIHNQWCGDFDTIYPMEAFDQIMSGKTPLDIATMVIASEGEFYSIDNFFSFDYDGDKVISSNDPCLNWIDMEILAGYIDDNNEDFGVPDLEFILELSDEDVEMLTSTMQYVDSLERHARETLEGKYGADGTFELARQITIRLFGF